MMVRYVGAGDDPPARCVFKGIEFERGGDPVEVADEATLAKIAGNPSFEVVESEPVRRTRRQKVKPGEE